MTGVESSAKRIDTSRPHPARVYDWLLDGKDNYLVDEELGNRILSLSPLAKRGAKDNRAFMRRATRWLVREAGVRWAFDAEHRADFGLSDFVQNTWRFGLDRLLAGVAMSDDSGAWLDRTLPLDDVGSGQVDLVGRLAEYVDRLRAVTDDLVGTHPLEHWLAVLGRGIGSLTAVPASAPSRSAAR